MNFERKDELFSFPYGFKHGKVIEITDEEYEEEMDLDAEVEYDEADLQGFDGRIASGKYGIKKADQGFEETT